MPVATVWAVKGAVIGGGGSAACPAFAAAPKTPVRDPRPKRKIQPGLHCSTHSMMARWYITSAGYVSAGSSRKFSCGKAVFAYSLWLTHPRRGTKVTGEADLSPQHCRIGRIMGTRIM